MEKFTDADIAAALKRAEENKNGDFDITKEVIL